MRKRERERDCVHKLTTVTSLAASQMDGDHYVPISIVASFNQVYIPYIPVDTCRYPSLTPLTTFACVCICVLFTQCTSLH